MQRVKKREDHHKQNSIQFVRSYDNLQSDAKLIIVVATSAVLGDRTSFY